MTRLAILAALALSSACSDPDAVPVDAAVHDATPARGSFSLDWTLSQGGVPTTCAAVGGDLVRITMHPTSGASGFIELFDCATGTGTSALRPSETYNVDFDLTRTDGEPVPGMGLTGFSIVPAQTTAMPDLTFDLPPP
jgi:hypothetical protein